VLIENAEDMRGSLRNRKARYLVEDIPARPVPLYHLRVDVDSLRKRLVTLGVIGVYSLPRRQHEHGGMEGIGGEYRGELAGRQSRRLMEQAQGVDQPPIKEYPPGRARLIEILLEVSSKDLTGEAESIWSSSFTAT
jgi:hypothetical protein